MEPTSGIFFLLNKLIPVKNITEESISINLSTIKPTGSNITANILFGRFEEARSLQKSYAKMAVDNFDIYESMPNVTITDVPPEVIKQAIINKFKFFIYSLFSSKTPEEKLLQKMHKEYLKELKMQGKKIETVAISMSTGRY